MERKGTGWVARRVMWREPQKGESVGGRLTWIAKNLRWKMHPMAMPPKRKSSRPRPSLRGDANRLLKEGDVGEVLVA